MLLLYTVLMYFDRSLMSWKTYFRLFCRQEKCCAEDLASTTFLLLLYVSLVQISQQIHDYNLGDWLIVLHYRILVAESHEIWIIFQYPLYLLFVLQAVLRNRRKNFFLFFFSHPDKKFVNSSSLSFFCQKAVTFLA